MGAYMTLCCSTQRAEEWTWKTIYTEYDKEYVDKFYKHVEPDTGRRYALGDIGGPGGAAKGNPKYEVMGVTRSWRYSQEKMQELLDEGRIVQVKPGAVPRYKRYLDEMPGVSLQDIWNDINNLSTQSKERVGYPTQKPVALLDRIIRASSIEGDIVLDPFCGCATACVAADRLDRQWVGIDLSPLAAKLVHQRIQSEGSLLYDLTHRTDIPRRTDVGQVPHYRTQKHTLFGLQEGICNGCQVTFPFRNFTVDHIIPRSRGGTDHADNLQLLCAACNSLKGNRTQPELIADLRRQGIIE